MDYLSRALMMTVTAMAFALTVGGSSSYVSANNDDDNEKILQFQTMVGVPRPFTGTTNAVRGIPGGGLPWVVASARGELRVGGEVKVRVRGLVLDPNDDAVINSGRAGINPAAFFKVIVSCYSRDEAGNPIIVNRETLPFPADPGGNSRIDDRVELPTPCIAPIVFVTSENGSWFGATGF